MNLCAVCEVDSEQFLTKILKKENITMKKLFHIAVTLCSTVIAVFFLLYAGPQLMTMQTGPEPLKPEQSFADAAGTYISYEAAYPVAFWAEES